MQEHPIIELYINVGDKKQDQLIEQMLSSIDLDEIAALTLQAAGIIQQVMLTLLITDDKGIHEMNAEYRQQDKPTDVLSFPLLDRPLVQAPADQLWPSAGSQSNAESPAFVTPPELVTNLGDIVMSWSTIVKQAAQVGHSPVYELLYLLSHGVLHLIGFDDHTESGYRMMVHIQQTVLATAGQKA